MSNRFNFVCIHSVILKQIFLYFVNLYYVKMYFNYIMLFLKFIVMKLVKQVCQVSAYYSKVQLSDTNNLSVDFIHFEGIKLPYFCVKFILAFLV